MQTKIFSAINFDLYYSESEKTKPVIIISHGFKGWKDWGFFPYISEQLAKSGAIVICHNFSLNGNPDETGFITKTEDFALNTISQEVEDLSVLIQKIKNIQLSGFKEIADKWNGEIFLLGHSLGGGVSIICGFSNPAVKKIIVLASVGKFDRYSKRQIEIWEKDGYMEFNNQKTNQILRMNFSYYEDLIQNSEKYDLSRLVSEYPKPILLIHGKQDITVPLKEIELLILADKNNVIEKHIVEKTGHTFGVEHPFMEKNEVLERIIKICSEFLSLIQN